MTNLHAQSESVSRPGSRALLRILLATCLMAHASAWALEPEPKSDTAPVDDRIIRDQRMGRASEGFALQIGSDTRTIKEPEPKARVQHVFSSRSWAPRNYDDGSASQATRSPLPGASASDAKVDEVGGLKNWMTGQTRSGSIAAAVTKQDAPRETRGKTVLLPTAAGRPNQRNRPIVLSPSGSGESAHDDLEDEIPEAGSAREPDEQVGFPQRRSPTRW